MTPRSRRTPPTMNFSEDVKYYLKILYYEYFPQHHAKKNEESGEAQRERYALMRSRCSEVPHKMSFREDVAARYSRKIVYFSAVLAPQHTHESREKKRTKPFLFCRHFLISREVFIALLFSFASLSSRRSCGWLCIPFREAFGVRDTKSERHHHHTAKGKKSPRR